MAHTRPLFAAAFTALLAAGSLAGAANAQPRWDWRGGGPDDVRAFELMGPGVPDLLPELRDSRRGHAFVLRNFDFDHDGLISRREARAANRAFLEVAGQDRGRFDWDRRGGPGGPPPPPPPPSGGWDREGMRGYHFREGRYGAVFTLQDVLFQTGSAALRPGAEARLRPLAGFLHAHPRVRLRIDGFTDSVGSSASNLTLSRDRARSVAAALGMMGVDVGRLQMEGHGETMPVATNATAAGRQLNRRVEVTLIGQHARTFN